MIKTWSPSRLLRYEECPFRARLEWEKLCPLCFKGHLMKGGACDKCKRTPEEPEAFKRGTKVHGEAEQYVAGRVKKMHPELKGLAWLLKDMRKEYQAGLVRVELELAVDEGWAPVPYGSSAAWGRFKLDLLYMKGETWQVIDWKTGRYRDGSPYGDQLNAYSVAVLSCYPEVPRVTSALAFLDEGQVIERPSEATASRATLKRLQGKWTKRVSAMTRDKMFPPAPSFACRWCPFSRNKGGPCKF